MTIERKELIVNKVSILLGIMLLVGPALAAEGGSGLPTVTFDTTWVSKYMWHGFNLYGHDNSAIQPSIDINFPETGFGATVWHSQANRAGFRNVEEFDYILYYANSAFADSTWAMDYSVSWLYYDYYDNKSRDTDLQELILSFSWPNLLPGGIVPSYSTGKLWPARSGVPGMRNVGGWVHVFGLGYDLTTPGILSASKEQVFSFMADLTYNDGYNGAAVDHDWSHVTLGAATGFDIARNLTFTPGLYYQISMDDSVNRKDEIWTSLSLTYQF